MLDSTELIEAMSGIPIPDPYCRTCSRQLPRSCFGTGELGNRYVSCLDCRWEPECTECGRLITLTKRDGLRNNGSVIAPFRRGFDYQCTDCVPLPVRDIKNVAMQYPHKVGYLVGDPPSRLKEELAKRCRWVVGRERGVRSREEAVREKEAELRELERRLLDPSRPDREKGARWLSSARKRITDYGTGALAEVILPSEVVRQQGSESCAICEDPDDLVLDHVMPLAAAGTHTLDNVRLLCAECNGWKVAEIDRPLIEARRRELRRTQLAAA